MAHTIACRILSYGKYQERGWSHLPVIGVTNVEIPVPPPDECANMKRKLADHGLKATSLQSLCDITKPEAVEIMRPQLETCVDFGAKYCFLSAKPGDTEPAHVWERLRGMGDVAASLGVTIVIETHPPLATNGDLSRETIEAINHPNVRINFDTANIFFYNENRTAVAELAKCINYVASVHLKDTPGRYQEWNFPALGTGVVNFPEIFRMLDHRGFDGPYTLELEGTKGVDRNEAEHLAYIADSVSYLRQIGVFD